MAGEIHDLTGAFANQSDVVWARCDGDGWVIIQTRSGIVPDLARCPRCLTRAIATDMAAMTPARFLRPVSLPDEVQAWAAHGLQAQGLYLAGPVGTGKTHAAWMAVAAWCHAALTRPSNGRVIVTRMVDLLDSLRPGGDSCDVMGVCQNAALLVIDDLGAERPTEWTRERLYSIVDHRYANCMPLIVTGNLPPKILEQQTGDRVASRLAEMCIVVPMTGEDRRRPEND